MKKSNLSVVKQEYVIEIELPDGFHWFVGLLKKEFTDPKTGAKQTLPMNGWSPYPEEALRLLDKSQAEELNIKLLADAGGIVLPVEEASFNLGYKRLPDGKYMGAKRIKNLVINDLFKVSETNTAIYRVVTKLDDGRKILCKRVQGKVKHERKGTRPAPKVISQDLVLGVDSNKWVYAIYEPVKQPDNVEQN